MVRAPTNVVRRLARAAARRAGREDEARALVRRMREGRRTLGDVSRRELRDDHGMRVVMASVLRQNSNAIDVGANRGAILARIVAVAPDGRHIAYEPIPALCERLAAQFPQVDVRCRALSDETGTAQFCHVLDAPGYSGFRLHPAARRGASEVAWISVQVEPLDDAVEPDYVPALLKVDVEGAELGVLRGAAALLERHRPFILFEHGARGAGLYGSRPEELFDLLAAAGLRIFDLDGDGPYARGRFESVFTQPIWNFLAAPL